MNKFGLIGIGYWGKNYLRIFNELNSHIYFYGVMDLNQDLLNSVKNDYPNLYCTNNLEDLVKNVDSLIIATPATTHYKVVKYCIEQKKNVLVEKPLTLSVSESEELDQLAKDNNITLMIGFTILYTNGYNYLKKYIQDNDSKIYYIHCKRTNLGIIRQDCNVIYDLTSHDIAVVLSLLNMMPEWVNATEGCYVFENNCDVSFITMGFKDNITVNLYTSWLDCERGRDIVVITDKYRINFDDLNRFNPITIYNKAIKNIDDKIETLNNNITIPYITWDEPLKTQCKYFIDVINNNNKVLITDGELAVNVNKVIDKITKSLKTGKKEYLNDNNLMNDCLMIMNPRDIPIVKENFNKLDIPKVYFRGYLEKELEIVINNFIDQTNYDNYILVSDDVIVTTEILNNMRKYLKKYKIFTGYCNMWDGSDTISLCDVPLTLQNSKYPQISDYNWITFNDISNRDNVFQTYLASFALTGMRRHIWKKYPFKVYLTSENDIKGCSSDHHISYRLGKNNKKIYTHKDIFIKHLKKLSNSPLLDYWIVGKVNPQVIHQK